MSFTDEQIQLSRERLDIPEDWEWFTCSMECGDLVWVPPGVGDSRVEPVCSTACAMKLIEKKMMER